MQDQVTLVGVREVPVAAQDGGSVGGGGGSGGGGGKFWK